MTLSDLSAIGNPESQRVLIAPSPLARQEGSEGAQKIMPLGDTHHTSLPAPSELEGLVESATDAATFLKALGHDGRLMILCHLQTGPKSVTELENLLSARQAVVSQQLARLRLEGLVSARRDGQAIFYSILDPRVSEVIAVLAKIFCKPAYDRGEENDCGLRLAAQREDTMETLPYGMLAALVGLVGGIVLGLAARLGDFCTLGALESAVYGQDQKRLRIWGIVLGVAILGTQFGALAGWINLSETLYHALTWNPLGSILGGLVFGYGMAMAGNCGFGALVRFGGGDLRSLVVVVVMGIFGFIALSGPLAPARTLLFPQPDATGPQGIVHDLGSVTGLPATVIVVAIGLSFVLWALSYPPLRSAHRNVLWAAAAGLAVVWCFAGTTWVSDYSLGAVDVEGPSFTAPVGRTLIFLMTSTAGGITFSVGAVVGVMVGALIGSTTRGLFRWEACEDPRELGRQVGGAVLMGIGGVVAMGCSVGQGVTAFAALAWSGPVTLMAIVAGALFGLRQLISGYQPD